VLSKIAEIGRDPIAFASELQSIGLLGKTLALAPLSEADSIAIAELRPRTRRFGLSLGDRAYLALGARLGARVLTADRAWARLTGPHGSSSFDPSRRLPGPGRPRDR
jgi:ribonuclease VapC